MIRPTSNPLEDMLSSGIAIFGQGARILKLRFSEQSNIPEDTLLPHRIVGEESLSQLYRYTLDCLSVDSRAVLRVFAAVERKELHATEHWSNFHRCHALVLEPIPIGLR